MMKQWWQHLPSNIDPFVLEIGSFRVGWYGLMYVIGFFTVYGLALYRSRKEGFPYGSDLLQDFLVWVAFGLIIGVVFVVGLVAGGGPSQPAPKTAVIVDQLSLTFPNPEFVGAATVTLAREFCGGEWAYLNFASIDVEVEGVTVQIIKDAMLAV
ncbi:hypothetical protein LCGC14_1810910, partial [marine sediment metagenome]